MIELIMKICYKLFIIHSISCEIVTMRGHRKVIVGNGSKQWHMSTKNPYKSTSTTCLLLLDQSAKSHHHY